MINRFSLAAACSGALAAACVHAQQNAGPGELVRAGPITRWDEAVPLGNGMLGGLVWGEGNVVRISLDRGDLWDLRTPEMLTRPDWTYATMRRLKEAGDHARHVEMFDAPYDTVPYPTKLPGGRVELTFGPGVKVERFTLDLAEAGATVEMGAAKMWGFFSASAPVALFEVHPDAPAVRIVRPAGLDKLGYGAAATGIDQPGPDGGTTIHWMTQQAALGVEYTVAVGVRPDADGWLLGITIARTPERGQEGKAYDGPSSLSVARDQLRDAMSEGFERVADKHGAWWRAFWGASSVTIPDARLRRHYDLCKYFYGAASRRGLPPIPLQGVWTADEGGLPPWKGDYHNDLNTQMTYAAYQEAGLWDQGLSFLDFNWGLLPRYRRFAKEFYGLEGGNAAVVPGVMTLDGSPMGGWGQYSLSPTHSAWIAQCFYLHWKYTMDGVFLRERAYPWCAAVGEALAALLRQNEAGWAKLPLSTSPEIYDNSSKAWLPPNSNYDQSLLGFLFAANAEMARALGKAQAAATWDERRAMLEPLETDQVSGALMFAEGLPYNESHRHFSHAMAIYPLGTLTVEGSDTDRRTIAATIEQLDKMGTRAWCGYSFAWVSGMCARAGQGERALEYLEKYLSFTGPNGFHLNGDQSGTGLSGFTYRPFTLEGNFAAMQAVQEMLMQSWGGVVRVFPAASAKWADASFRDLRAEGGWRVSAVRRGGRTVSVTVAAEHGGKLRLRDPFGGREAKWSREGMAVIGTNHEVTMKPGETIEGSVP